MVGAAVATPGADKAVLPLDKAYLVDAFALGMVIRYMLTGVPPGQSIMQAIEAQGMLASCGCIPKGARRIVELSSVSEAARQLTTALTKPSLDERMSVADAQAHAWVKHSTAAADKI